MTRRLIRPLMALALGFLPMMDQKERVSYAAPIGSPQHPPAYRTAASGHAALSRLDTCRRAG
jgi:hypothetical protein